MAQTASFLSHPRVRIAALIVLLAIGGVFVWLYVTAGRESTDDAQIDGHVTQIAARVGGTVQRVAVDDNQLVEPGTVLVEIDQRDYKVALDRARAELADAEASAIAAQSNVPITATTTSSSAMTSRAFTDRS